MRAPGLDGRLEIGESLEGTVLRSLTEIQKGPTFYLITLGLALLVAQFGPHRRRRRPDPQHADSYRRRAADAPGHAAAVADNPTTAAYLTGETGVFTLVALVILARALMRRSATRKEDQLVMG
jgi:hypothetical protein